MVAEVSYSLYSLEFKVKNLNMSSGDKYLEMANVKISSPKSSIVNVISAEG